MVSWLVWGRRGGLVTLAAVTLGSSCMVARPDVLVEDCAVGAVVCVLLAVSVAKVIDLQEGKPLGIDIYLHKLICEFFVCVFILVHQLELSGK